MIGNIGKCDCINSIDRQEILLAINDLVEKRRQEFEKIKKILTDKKIITPADKYKHPTILTYESLIDRSEKVKQRIENIPEC